MGSTGAAELGRIFREEAGRIVASLIRSFGDIDTAEEAVQEACALAADRWPRDGVPANPGGWLTTTARRRALDRIRREGRRSAKEGASGWLTPPAEAPEEPGPVHDDRLRLIFTCCHPALARHAQVALTLRLLGGWRRPRSPAPSSCQRRRWRSGSCVPNARSGQRTFPSRCPTPRR